MKTQNIFLVAVFMLSLGVLNARAQQREFVSINHVNAGINSGGDLFRDIDKDKSLFEAPKGSGKTMIYAFSLWIGGYDDQGNLHTACQTYKQSQNTDFYAEPVAGNYTGVYDYLYNRVWKIERSAIEDH